MSKQHPEHIVCIKQSAVAHCKDGLVDYKLTTEDLMLGQRSALEFDPDFRQVIPTAIFTCKGKIWTYMRTKQSSETNLHKKVSVSVGGHWDMKDVCLNDDGSINLEESFRTAMNRELGEEIIINANILKSTQFDKMICANDTKTDRIHIGAISMHELDCEDIQINESHLEAIGFLTPDELLNGDYDIEVWTRIVCELFTDMNDE
ncbi:hypothetical protein L1267_18890 [Pseudoalteromonas sp. OFAV1]|uniref:hypothetical protein n=1 Tax=Pseudoalteromonas sp. OFAV1 TaxID=2908892 RepID=UPI001F3B647E|nr:hypothetical protein [Pseudoalteromonas sp. OFAV1]MCF2902440.1 hypothetical protein [Pseudoalteromonas sp. OFAV1]